MDWIRLRFICVVLFISSIIIFYRSEYINHDLNFNRFFFLVLFFIISILLIILSPNLIRILLGWDGLGLISYCLVIYYQRRSRYNSGILTILINRIGDVFILIRIGILLTYGSWNFINLNNVSLFILLLIVLASFTKSAQFPFSSWLPAAIAAPTPVSSLVHSSTLVTAGIYLLIRFHYLIFKNDLLLFYVIIRGLLTILMAGISANLEYDLKKIIAYSTLSQLGLIIIIYGVKNFELTYFHLLVHALFKSIIFMCSGIIIHRILNYQDIRFIGLLSKFIPLTCIILIVGNFSLCGIPFISGFFSKDQILEFIIINNLNFICYLFIIVGTGLTVSYRIRLAYYLINNSYNFFPMYNFNNNIFINISIIFLLNLTIFIGYYLNWIIFSIIEEVYLLFFEKILILLICVIFLKLGFKFYKINFNYNYLYYFKFFFGKIWFLYNLNFIIIKNPLIIGLFVNKILDKGWIELFSKKIYLINSYKLINLFILNKNFLINLFLLIRYLLIILFLFY